MAVKLLESFGMKGLLHQDEGEYQFILVVDMSDSRGASTHFQPMQPIQADRLS